MADGDGRDGIRCRHLPSSFPMPRCRRIAGRGAPTAAPRRDPYRAAPAIAMMRANRGVMPLTTMPAMEQTNPAVAGRSVR